MSRRPNPRRPTIQYRGVIIRFYRRRSGWKSTFQLHGHKRRECYGSTQKVAQKAAELAISRELDPNAVAAGRDETTARALLLEHGVSLTEAARFWLTKNAKPIQAATVEEVRDRWLTLREQAKGYHYTRGLKARSKHFVKAFAGKRIGAITTSELALWQDSLGMKLEGRTVRNIHDATKQIFKFARKRNYLDHERLSAMEMVDRPRAGSTGKEVYTPQEMQRLLDAAWGLASPAAVAMAITAFTAIRSEEISSVDPQRSDNGQLAWEDFRWKENFIHIREEIAKMRTSRSVPLPKNLRRMLQSLKAEGPVYQEKRLDLAYARIARQAGLTWKFNALRHSAITYAMLLNSSPAEVANRAGNSVATIESNYRNRGATKVQARAWFKLFPKLRWGSLRRKKARMKKATVPI